MKLAPLAILASLVTVGLSGCLAGDAEPAATTESGTAAPSTTEGAPNATANQAPIIGVQILVNGTEIQLLNESYPVPAGEAVTFDASSSSDPEGLNLTFAWDFGGNGSASDAMANHTFADAGNYTVTLTVTDEEGAASEASYNLTVAPSGPAPGTQLRVEKKTYTGTITAGVQTTTCGTGVGAAPSHVLEIPAAEPDGTAVSVSRFLLKLTGGTTNLDTDLEFYGVDGKLIKSATGSSATETIDVEGAFPAGKYTLKLVACAAVNASYSLTAEATLVAA